MEQSLKKLLVIVALGAAAASPAFARSESNGHQQRFARPEPNGRPPRAANMFITNDRNLERNMFITNDRNLEGYPRPAN